MLLVLVCRVRLRRTQMAPPPSHPCAPPPPDQLLRAHPLAPANRCQPPPSIVLLLLLPPATIETASSTSCLLLLLIGWHRRRSRSIGSGRELPWLLSYQICLFNPPGYAAPALAPSELHIHHGTHGTGIAVLGGHERNGQPRRPQSSLSRCPVCL